MAGIGHLTIRANTWFATFKGDATGQEWSALRDIARAEFKIDMNNATLDDETRQLAGICIALLNDL